MRTVFFLRGAPIEHPESDAEEHAHMYWNSDDERWVPFFQNPTAYPWDGLNDIPDVPGATGIFAWTEG